MAGCNFAKISTINVPKRYRGKHHVSWFKKKLSKLSEFYCLKPGLYPSITDIIEAMNTLIQERHNDSESCIRVEVSRRTQKIENYIATEEPGLAFFNTDPGHIFGSNVGNGFGVMLRRRRRPHKPKLAYDIVHKHSLKLYTDLIEYNIVGDTQALLLRCFAYVSKLKIGDIVTSGHYINYHTFSNL